MLDDKYSRLAYKGEPIPTDVKPEDKPAYTLLCELYRLHRMGVYDVDTAKVLKEKILNYAELPVNDRIALITFTYPHLLEQIKNAPVYTSAMLLFEELAKLKAS